MKHSEFEQIVEDFNFLDDWEDKYRYVIEEGKKMPALDDSLKVDSNKVNGCASQVWLNFSISDTLYFEGDSDAIIVKGLIAILRKLYNNTPIDEIQSISAWENLKRLGLDDHLSTQRSNGVKAMVEKIKSFG
ncbi:MAG: SufE family protein [Paracoccaceae bacterium]|nr:SufE family protein [Paracoccaceae bacterium]